jgi:hypothetical protein
MLQGKKKLCSLTAHLPMAWTWASKEGEEGPAIPF